MDTIAFLREQLGMARAFLAGTLADVDAEAAHAPAPGRLNPIAATYTHLVVGEDGFVNGIVRGTAPLFAAKWSGRTGISELPPAGPGWSEWGRGVRVDLAALRWYADAVAQSTDRFVASLSPNDLDRAVDLGAFGFGKWSLGCVLGAGVLGHLLSHRGEVAALKGLQGGTGFPR
ncbi:MAG: DinB family protein [Chloroflexota bacterium]|nr:DinB family protein [Chloroflexota bacterium]